MTAAALIFSCSNPAGSDLGGGGGSGAGNPSTGGPGAGVPGTGGNTDPSLSVHVIIRVPIRNETPRTTATAARGYDGNFTVTSVSWDNSLPTFQSNSVYTVTITLTAETGHTFNGLTQENAIISYGPAAIVDNTGTTLTLTRTFPPTYNPPGTYNHGWHFHVKGQDGNFFVPVTGGTPADAITTFTHTPSTDRIYSVTWSPNHTTFQANTVYTIYITSTESTGRVFASSFGQNFSQINAVTNTGIRDNTGKHVTVFRTFPATGP